MKKIMFTAILFCIAGQLKLQAQAMAAVHESLRYIYAEEGAVQLQQPANLVNEKSYVGNYFSPPRLTKPANLINGSGVEETYTQTASIKAVKAEVFSNDEPTEVPAEKSVSTKPDLAGISIVNR